MDQKNSTQLKKLIGLFEHNLKQYKGKHYDEAKARADFIDKFFELLGWDVYNKKGYSEQYRDVVREDRVEVKGKVKAPDYCFRIGGARKFFVEAKKPAIDIKYDIEPAFQLRRYAYTARLPLSILTDFEEFAVYDTRIKPDKRDQASSARIFYCTYQEYEKEYDFIFNTFSREAILKGSFDQYIESSKRKKGTSEVDKEFLKLIEQWRENLAKNIAMRNKDLSIYELNYMVQKIIDRIIFLRIAEDRHIEDYGRIQKLADNQGSMYPEMVKLFLQADVKYDSGLFDFKTDQITPHLKIDDKVLKDIIKSLYYPDSPYEFSVFDVEILGNIYEQFLGKTIRLTASHQARVEDKPEVKKAGGVYYTPKYIVDYIVKNTVAEKIKNQTPDQISKLKICDPACGSGSFLLGAYQILLDYHLDYYTQEKNIKKALKENKIYQLKENEYRLSIEEKHRILLNNIFGVDIDSQAVEVTRLSLLLKLLEGESRESFGLLFKFSDIKLLPDLSDNIKCGNSLIGSDFYEKGQMDLFKDEETTRRINVFDWDKEFPEIFKNGGFDIIIGNPPYVRQEMLKESKEYFSAHYQIYHGVTDLYAYFIEKGIGLLRRGGYFGFIVANKWMRAGYGQPLRRFLKHKQILQIVDFGDLPIFEKATTYPCILLVKNHDMLLQGSNRSKPGHKFDAVRMKTLSFGDLTKHVKDNAFQIDMLHLDDSGWSLVSSAAKKLMQKLHAMFDNGKAVTLGDYVQDKIYYGIKTGLNKAFVIDEATKNKLIDEDPKSAELIKPFLAGRDIKRYQQPVSDKYLIFTRRGIDIKKYPTIENYLLQFKEQLQPKPKNFKGKKWPGRKPGTYQWYEIQDAIDYFIEFEKPKIIYPEIALKGQSTIDEDKYYSETTSYIIGSSSKYLLGILNSKLFLFMMSLISSEIRGGYYRWKRQYISPLLIRTLDLSNPEELKLYKKMIIIVEKILFARKSLSQSKIENDRKLIKKQIDIFDNQIDQLVYELYGLTKEEIKIVEGKVNE